MAVVVSGDTIDRCVEGAAAAHQRLLSVLDERMAAGGFDPRAPSHLPGWTVGHVLTHLARDADGLVVLFEAASQGRVGDQYQGGVAQRDADIEAGADRSAADLIVDLRRSVWALEAAWVACSAEGWAGRGRCGEAGVAVADLPFRRWREVEVHGVDLDLGLTFEDWSPEYVRWELVRQEMTWRARMPMGLSSLPREVLALPPPVRLAWLLGRVRIDGLPEGSGR